MENRFEMLKSITTKGKKYCFLIIFLLLMLVIHHYVFMYADDLYYCHDAQEGLKKLPHFMLGVLNENGRVWVHVLLLGIVKYNVYLFRIINPVGIMFAALMIAKISIGSDDNNKRFIIATACACMFFILLPIEISGTTIYYAACSLNYLYPTAVSIIYGYLLYSDYSRNSDKYKTRLWIVVLAFFAGSSTQQAGMIAIGFTVLISLYFKFYKKIRFEKNFIAYYCSLFIGYSLVTYGSVRRSVFEKTSGKSMDIPTTIDTMLKTNIFGIPAVGYVLIICLCSIYWLYHYSCENNKGINKVKVLANKLLACVLSLATIGYAYCVLSQRYNVKIFVGDGANIMLSLCFIAFTLVYLISILNVSLLILLKERYPFIFFCCINAFGAQMMLIVADPRFAGSYKIIFPSLLLMSIFIVYSFVKFYHSKIFLSLAMFAIALSVGKISITILALAFVVLFTLCKIFSANFKLLKLGMVATFLYIAVSVFCTNYNGYKAAAQAQNFNLNAIKEYHQSDNKGVLKLKKTPPTIYGYNVSNWNDMPYFMKQCYKISENTVIEYYK